MATLRTEELMVQTPSGPMRTELFAPSGSAKRAAILFYSEIFQITGPVRRAAQALAGHGYLVAVPEVYHEFETPGTVLGYDDAGKDRGNALKTTKAVSAFDADAEALVQAMVSHPTSSGRVGAMGICLGGHLALRAALNPRVAAAACIYPTDVHSGTLGAGKNDDTLARIAETPAELLFVFGRQDPHIPLDGRRKIQGRLEETNRNYTWHEFNAAHAFMRDEGERYDPAAARLVWELVRDLFSRTLG